MRSLSLAVKDDSERLLDFIYDGISDSPKQVNLGMSEVPLEDPDMKIYKFDCDSNEMRRLLSGAVARYVITCCEPTIIERILNTDYSYFTKKEKDEIFALTLKILYDDDIDINDKIFRTIRQDMITNLADEYFKTNDDMNIMGFVNFRLKYYKAGLDDIVAKAVDKFLADKEYKEFIRLLRHFVELQDPCFLTVHIRFKTDNKYDIFDDKLNKITDQCMQEYANEIGGAELNYDDMLVSSLISLAPKKLVLHNPTQYANKELIETVKNVFGNKVTICNGCLMCYNKSATKS